MGPRCHLRCALPWHAQDMGDRPQLRRSRACLLTTRHAQPHRGQGMLRGCPLLCQLHTGLAEQAAAGLGSHDIFVAIGFGCCKTDGALPAVADRRTASSSHRAEHCPAHDHPGCTISMESTPVVALDIEAGYVKVHSRNLMATGARAGGLWHLPEIPVCHQRALSLCGCH